MDASTHLVVFCRLPVPGKVKTRLAASVGHAKAAEFYRACAQHIISLAASCPVQLSVFYSFGDDATEVQQWIHGFVQQHTRLQLHPQSSSPDLGEKMRHAMSTALASPGCSKVIIIGTDIPDITPQLLEQAVRALDSYEVVVGPAVDGGYYLLGLTQVHSSLFQDIAWSTPSVLQATLSRAVAAGLRPAPLGTLPTLLDIDTVQDLREWAAQHCPAPAPGLRPAAEASSCSTPTAPECGAACPLTAQAQPAQDSFMRWLRDFTAALPSNS